MDRKIDINSGDWNKKNSLMFYSHSKSVWYCTKCDEIIKSPRTANTHADAHGLSLPCSRKKLDLPKNVPVKEYSEPTRSSVEEFRQTVFGSINGLPERPHNHSRNYSPIWSPTIEAKKRELDEFSKKLEYLMIYKQAGATDQELQQAKIDLGFIKPFR